MTTIDLDPSLKPTPLFWHEPPKREEILNRWAGQAKVNGVASHVELTGTFFHPNYLTYLEQCWDHHRPVVITPDILWFTLLNEVASLVRDNAEPLRHLFSTSKDKQRIVVLTGSPVVLPIESVVERLRELVPSGADTYLPEFSTSDAASRMACSVAFCDAVSPYYSYGMMMCGIPRVIVRGTVEDYVKVAESWRALPKEIHQINQKWSDNVQRTLEDVARHVEVTPGGDQVRRFWSRLFTAEICGSGHQIEVDGWFPRLFRKQPKNIRYVSNFDSHLAKVDYDLMETGQTFSMLAGVLSSIEDTDGTLHPQFGRVVFETTPGKVAEERDREDAAATAWYVITLK